MYRELPPPEGLRRHVRCLWVRSDDGASRPGTGVMIVPDGCTDVMSFERGVVVAGPDDRPMAFSGDAGTIVGVRFRPGRAAALGTPLGELRNLRVTLGDVWGADAHELEDRLDDAASTADRLDVLVRSVADRIDADANAGIDPIVDEVVRRLGAGQRPAISALADDVGLSERQLRRRVIHALGYGPTTFARIVRFQKAMDRVRSGDALVDVAVGLGFTDQAHLTREVRALAGRPPGAIARDAA